ncbi:MAG: GGDEF domain-containing protein [Planctomycetota bacterium]
MSDRSSIPAVLDRAALNRAFGDTKAELARRSAFLGVIAWLSVCLVTTAMFPVLAEQLRSLWMMSGLVGLASAVGLMQLVTRVERRHFSILTELQKEACTDALTGIANRRVLDQHLAEVVLASREDELPLCLMMIDIDYFKSINDAYGHAVGDDVLKNTSVTLTTYVRTTDIVSRYGGEEFVVVTPGVDLTMARRLSERIRVAVQQQDLPTEVEEQEVTVSIGLTALEDGDEPASLLDRADNALYHAKHGGRNCTFCYVDGNYLCISPGQHPDAGDEPQLLPDPALTSC